MSGAEFDLSGLTRQADRLRKLDAAALRRVEQRASATLARRLPVEAATLASERILALPRSTVRKGLGARTSGAPGAREVALSGNKRRIPLRQFGARYGGRKSKGATATVYRDRGVQMFEGTFAIKGRGVRGGIFQRVPGAARLPIVERAGPSVARAITSGEHGDIMPDLRAIGGDVLATEAQRLLRAELR